MRQKEHQRSKDKIQEAISDDSAQWVGGPGSILSSLYRKIMRSYNIRSSTEWSIFMEKYLKNPRNNIPPDHRAQTSARSNMFKELFKPQMSWKVFCKGMSFLMVEKFEIQITIFRRNQPPSIHVQAVDLSEMINDPYDPDDKDNNE